jgi:hypothetical protein
VFGHGADGDHDVVGGSCHDGGRGCVHCLVATNSLAEGNGRLDLLVSRQGTLVCNMMSLFRLWWGRGEMSEIPVDLRWGRGWFRW